MNVMKTNVLKWKKNKSTIVSKIVFSLFWCFCIVFCFTMPWFEIRTYKTIYIYIFFSNNNLHANLFCNNLRLIGHWTHVDTYATKKNCFALTFCISPTRYKTKKGPWPVEVLQSFFLWLRQSPSISEGVSLSREWRVFPNKPQHFSLGVCKWQFNGQSKFIGVLTCYGAGRTFQMLLFSLLTALHHRGKIWGLKILFRIRQFKCTWRQCLYFCFLLIPKRWMPSAWQPDWQWLLLHGNYFIVWNIFKEMTTEIKVIIDHDQYL